MTAPTNAEIDESLFFLEQLARDHHNDGAPETALYINRAAAMLRALRDQREADARDAARYHACRHVALADDNDPVVIKAGQMDEANTPAEFDVQIDKIVAAMSAQGEK